MNPLDCECNCHQLDHADNCSCYCMMGGMSYREMEEQLSKANDVPVITGDSDTDELLEIERCNQESEDKNE